jgi:hypothetical protein
VAAYGMRLQRQDMLLLQVMLRIFSAEVNSLARQSDAAGNSNARMNYRAAKQYAASQQ